MFRFKFKISSIFYATWFLVSIHPMFRFKLALWKADYGKDLKFQYILCFGSRIFKLMRHKSKSMFQYILCFGSRKRRKLLKKGGKEFQYILCFGSRDRRSR